MTPGADDTGALAGRVVLIAGASIGIEADFGRACAAAGARIVLEARRTERTAELAAAITEAGGAALSETLCANKAAGTSAPAATLGMRSPSC